MVRLTSASLRPDVAHTLATRKSEVPREAVEFSGVLIFGCHVKAHRMYGIQRPGAHLSRNGRFARGLVLVPLRRLAPPISTKKLGTWGLLERFRYSHLIGD